MKGSNFHTTLLRELESYGYQYEEKTGINGKHIITTINLDEDITSSITMHNDGTKNIYRLQLAKETFIVYTDKVIDIIGVLEYKC